MRADAENRPKFLNVRLALVALVALSAVAATLAGSASAASRMPIGFFDDPSFRWSADAEQNIEAAHKAGAQIIVTTADWSRIARTRPANPLNGDDPAYDLTDLDVLVERAHANDMQLLVTISRCPKWANGGQTPNYPPTHLQDLTNFAHMLAARYRGGGPHGLILRWSIWNEPNLGMFLMPQFNKKGKIVSPQIYAKLYMAGYKGLKAGNKNVLVAVGETSNQGRDHPSKGVGTISVAPATFAQLLSKAAPHLPFDAWATHPYPTKPNLPPTQKVAWPNVTLTQLGRFGESLQAWYHRRVPIWVTEYAEQVKPNYPGGVTAAQQAKDMKKAMQLVQTNPYVEMFVWFTFRDSPSTWQSGVKTASGVNRPSFNVFKGSGKLLAGWSQLVTHGKKPSVRLFIPYITSTASIGASITVTYKVRSKGRLVGGATLVVKQLATGSVVIKPNLLPRAKQTYTLTATSFDPTTGTRDSDTVVLTGV